MIIEKMTPRDLPEVATLAAQLGYPISGAEIESRFQKIEDQDSYALYTARDKTGAVRGWVQVNAEPFSLLIGPRADVAALVVDESHRSRGIGKALLKKAEEWAREHRLSLIRVRSNVTRRDAHRFYQREGYSHSKVANIFIKILDQ